MSSENLVTSTTPQDAIAPMLRPGLPHLVGALPQLQSYNAEGATVFALTVCGARQDAIGSSTLVGPAVSPAGVSMEWPEIARDKTKLLFEKNSARMAGAVLVILIVQAGREAHCAIINVPTAARGRARRGTKLLAVPQGCRPLG